MIKASQVLLLNVARFKTGLHKITQFLKRWVIICVLPPPQVVPQNLPLGEPFSEKLFSMFYTILYPIILHFYNENQSSIFKMKKKVALFVICHSKSGTIIWHAK